MTEAEKEVSAAVSGMRNAQEFERFFKGNENRKFQKIG